MGIFRTFLALAALALPALAPAASPSWHVVPGNFEPGRGPDGNSIFLDAPDGLILVDTGRHPAHRDRLLAFARAAERPVAAIFNTHWHLDHTTGNAELRAAWPAAPLVATRAIEGALTGFLRDSRVRTRRMLDEGRIAEANRAEVERGLAAIDNLDALRPTRPVTRSEEMVVAGRPLRVHVAPYAVTEADLWIHDPAAGLVIAGDLVVAEVPFMDTACPEGWRRALDEMAAVDFTVLIPGHGEAMDRDTFLAWRAAFGHFLDCAASDRSGEACVGGWRRDAARFIAPGRERLVDEMATYYLDTRLRAPPGERDLYCPAR